MGLTRPTVAQLNTVVTEISDPISVLNKGSTLANVDVGFVFNRDSGASPNVAFYWNETIDSLVVAYTTSTGGVNSNIAVSSYANLTVGNITSSGNVSAQYLIGSGQYLTGLPAGYSNVNVKAYTETMGFQNFGNVNVAALITTNGLTNYSNVNLIAYLAGGITSTGFINTSGNISAAQINSATAVVTGSAFFGELFVKSPGGDEGGQINLANAVTNTTLVGNVVIDVFQNKLRIFEGGGTARGGYFDISALAAGVATNLVGGGGGTPGGGNGQLQFNSGGTFAGAASLYYFGANGAIVANAGIASTSTTTGTMQITGGIGVTGNVTADQIYAVNNGNGQNIRIGDDAWLGDVNVANTVRLMGAQDNTQAYLRFGNTNTSTLGVSGSGPLTWGGVLNVTGNILGATGTLSALNVNGFINTTGNVLSTGLSVFGNTRIGSLATPGALHTIIGNVDVSGAGTEFFNIGGNIMAIQGSFGSINSTGFINTTANVSAEIGSFNSITVRAAVTAIANGGTSGVGNIGATGATFNTVFAKATTAQYADLAEIYTSDQQYPAGTVLVFDGEAEVTQSHSPYDTRIAGVVSTNPAYLMNDTETGVPVALQGRVPCRVLGPVGRGEVLVSSHIPGVAQRLDPTKWAPGCVIGKALQAIDSTDISTIEVVVGRL